MKEIINTKKHEDFRKLINENRSKLRELGYSYATVSRWADGQRIPRHESAVKLAVLLDVPLTSIPYRMDIIL
jgi:transcriptional regulator with XRE-family HTH domain